MKNPFLVSFSGLDGSGKTQLIILLRRFLRRQGIHYLYIHTVRDSFDNRLAKKYPVLKAVAESKEENSSTQKVNKVKKIGLFSFYLRVLAIFCYGLSLRFRMISLVKEYQVIIFDRYVFDKLVNLAYLRGKENCWLTSLLVKIFPKIDLPIYLHVRPEQSLERKKEVIEESQDLEYFQIKYELFEKEKQGWKMITVDNSLLTLSEVKKKVLSLFKKRFYRKQKNSF